MANKVLIPLLILFLFKQSYTQELSIVKTIRECIKENTTLLCLKERALKIFDQAVISDHPIPVNDYIDIIRDTTYQVNLTAEEDLPRDLKERSETLNQLLLKRIDDFFESRQMKLKLKKVMQGRAKGGGGGNKGGKKGGGMMLLGGLAMAGMMAQLFMGKVAFMAGAALMISKMALLLTSVVGLKKLVSGSGGSDSHVVVASGGSEHGGWHRSLIPEDEAAIIAYRAQVRNQENSFL